MPLIPDDQIRVFDRQAMRAHDAQCIDQYGIPGIVLMENAGSGAAEVALHMTSSSSIMAIVCGRGNNGGDGWAMARHLANHGRTVRLIELDQPDPKSDAGLHRAVAMAMNIPITDQLTAMDTAEYIVDAILGTGLDREVHGNTRAAIEYLNASTSTVLAMDIPSGLHADRGCPMPIAVHATTTVTMGGWKQGFECPQASAYTGEILTIDIGAPRALADALGRPQTT